MSVRPLWARQPGQDSKEWSGQKSGYRKGYGNAADIGGRQPGLKLSDDEKLMRGLTEMMGPKAAKKYFNQRKNRLKREKEGNKQS
jgi:hypothetical protein